MNKMNLLRNKEMNNLKNIKTTEALNLFLLGASPVVITMLLLFKIDIDERSKYALKIAFYIRTLM